MLILIIVSMFSLIQILEITLTGFSSKSLHFDAIIILNELPVCLLTQKGDLYIIFHFLYIYS